MSKKAGRPKGSGLRSIQKTESEIASYIKQNPGTNPVFVLSGTLNMSRQAVLAHINRMIGTGTIRAEGKAKGRIYYISEPSESIDQLQMSVEDLAKAGEDEIFKRHIAARVLAFAQKNSGFFSREQYAITEVLNNVIDHSQASLVFIRIFLSPNQQNLIIELEDNGRGVFDSIKSFFHLEDYWEAVAELAKGKRTTDPARHAGEGLFFTARMADSFEIEANSLKYQYVSEQDDWSLAPIPEKIGSLVRLSMNLASHKSPQEVFEKFTRDYTFDQKSPRLANPYIINLPSGHLPSRSEAKKILAGAEAFASIVLDFKGVESIGQGFADEVFRVFKASYPNIEIEFKNASSFVLRMIAHVQKN